jgi:hypothetical protein
MIHYALVCEAGHEFEGWFRDSAAFETQAGRGLLTCAICGSSKVDRAVMAPAVARRDREAASSLPAVSPSDTSLPGSGMVAPALPPAQPVALIDPHAAALREAIRTLRRHVEANAENVGPAFAQTARDMHEGAIAHKPIYGVATPDEVSALQEDGIEALPLPILPDEHN